MFNYANTVVNQYGVPVVGASVTVNVAGTDTPATLYSDNGVTPTANPLTTGSLGMFNFYVQNGRYDLVVSGSGITPYTLYDQPVFDSEAEVTVTFSATPAFNLALGDQSITLTGNVTSSTATNPTAGQKTTFTVIQDATGGRTFAWPTNFFNAPAVEATANGKTVQMFISDGTNLYAISPASYI